MQKLAEVCIRRPVFATMLIMFLVVMGLDSYRKLGVDFFPKVEFPIVTITTTLRGAAPEEVESQVTKRIEEAVNTISGIDDLNSISAEGTSFVTLQFVLEKDPDVAAQEVRDKVSRVLAQLPEDADPPVVDKLATDASPVINVVVSSPRDLRETTKMVDDRIKKNLESLPGVGQVRFVGERTRQIQVWLDSDRMFGYGLNVDQVRNALRTQNVEIPGGNMQQGPRETSVRTLGRIEKPADFARVIISNSPTPVRIGDLADVVDGFEEVRSLARLDGLPAVVLEVRKQSGTNTLDVIRTVKERVDDFKRFLPPDFKFTYTRDQSDFITEAFEAVEEHLVLGGVLAGIIVLLFMRSWRSTLIAAVAIPTSIISTYTLMNIMGFTLNQITMLGLVLMVGIVIDDAIVVLENIFRMMEEKHLSPTEAAIQGTRDIGLAVMATTLSLVIIFLPVAFMPGIVGRFMSSFGFTAAFAIMVSLLVSFTLTPMLCSRFLKITHDGQTKDTILFRALSQPYKAMLRWSMSHRWVVALGCLLVMASSVPLFTRIGKSFLPTDDQSEFEILVKLPTGTSLEGTDETLKKIEEQVRSMPGVRNVLTVIGADVRRAVDRGSILVELVKPEQRKEKQEVLMAMARERLKSFKDVTIAVQLPSLIQGGDNRELLFYIQGPDLQQLDRYARAVRAKLQDVPGLVDFDTNYEPGKPELRVVINRDRAADFNVPVASIATAVRTLVAGDTQATTYREGDDRYDVQLRVKDEFRNSPYALQRLMVPSGNTGNMPLANLATLEPSTGPSQIARYNRQRQVLMLANIAPPQSLSNVLEILNKTVDDLKMPPEYRSGTVGRTKEFGRAGKAYMFAFLLSLVLMYMVLAAQFESFIDPITILLSLPLSVPFALLSLMFAGENFSVIYSSVGILVLFGIVKKNSILQIDHIKSLRREGFDRATAIMKGCEDRLRPILMTTAALVAGMIPLALGGGAGSGSRRTVAIAVIGGQTLCLLLTLLVTPVAYSIFDDLQLFLRRVFSRIAFRAVPATMLALALVAPVFGQPARVGVSVTERKLALSDAVEMALKSNLDLEIERTNIASAHSQAKSARGVYDSIFRYTPFYENRNTPTSSTLLGSNGALKETFNNHTFSYLQRLEWKGTSLHADFDNSRQSTSNPFVGLNPATTSRLIFGITHPLLRGRETDHERSEIRVRAKNVEISKLELELSVIDTVTRVELAYWDLVAARQNTTVAADGVTWAQEQLSRTRRAIDAGTVARVELAAAEAEFERRRDTHLASLAALTEAENALKLLVAGSRADEIWNDQIIPADQRTVDTAASDDLAQAVKLALDKRPEFRAITLRGDTNEIQRKLAADQAKPRIDLAANYAVSGLAGSQPLATASNPFSQSTIVSFQRLNELSARVGLPPIVAPSFSGGLPASLVGGYGTTLSNLAGWNYQTVQAGLSMDFNTRNTGAKAAMEQAVVTERRLKLERERLEQAVSAQVRNAMQSLATARQRIVAADASVRAAKEKLDSETRLFNTGESTNFFVLTRQNEHLDSMRRAVIARLDFNRAVARLLHATGSTLEARQLSVR